MKFFYLVSFMIGVQLFLNICVCRADSFTKIVEDFKVAINKKGLLSVEKLIDEMTSMIEKNKDYGDVYKGRHYYDLKVLLKVLPYSFEDVFYKELLSPQLVQ